MASQRHSHVSQARRLEQLSPECSGGVGSDAASEATMLLVALDSMLALV